MSQSDEDDAGSASDASTASSSHDDEVESSDEEEDDDIVGDNEQQRDQHSRDFLKQWHEQYTLKQKWSFAEERKKIAIEKATAEYKAACAEARSQYSHDVKDLDIVQPLQPARGLFKDERGDRSEQAILAFVGPDAKEKESQVRQLNLDVILKEEWDANQQQRDFNRARIEREAARRQARREKEAAEAREREKQLAKEQEEYEKRRERKNPSRAARQPGPKRQRLT